MQTKKELIKIWKARKYSWSQHSSFRDYNKEEWYQSYVLGNKKPTTREMTFGSLVGKRLETDPTYIPQLPRGTHMEYGIDVKLEKFELTGFMDVWDNDKRHIGEFKSGKNPWTQERVDSHDQITFYNLLLLLRDKIKPEEVSNTLYWLPTQDNSDFSISFVRPFRIESFTTKRTTAQVLKFAAEIIKQRKEMLEYIKNHE